MKLDPKEIYLYLEDFAGRPTRVRMDLADEWQKEQDELREKMERGEIWNPANSPDPETAEHWRKLGLID